MVRNFPAWRAAVAAAVLILPLSPLGAQCGFAWYAGAPAAGPSGVVHCAARLPNGDLVVGGQFAFADGAIANNVARWDGTNWQAFGTGVDGAVFTVLALANGDVVAAGRFLNAGGAPANRIARWDGTSWSPLGPGFANDVNCLLDEPNGDIVAGGLLTSGNPINRISRWNGSTWQAIGVGMLGVPNELLRLPTGELLAGTSSGLYLIVLSTWTAIPSVNGGILAMERMPNGDLFLAGLFGSGSTAYPLARWDGTTMHPVPTPFGGTLTALARAPNGDLFAGGNVFTSGTAHLHRWNGSSWSSVPPPPTPWVLSLLHDASGRLVGAGQPGSAGTSSPVFALTGAAWVALGATAPPVTTAVAAGRNGDAFVGGTFTAFEGVPARNIVRRHGGAWSPLGSGVAGPVTALAVAANGDLIVSGDFTTAGGTLANRIARWDGAAWWPLGAGLTSAATAIAVTPAGHVFTIDGLGTTLAHFDGSTWSPIAIPMPVGSSLKAIAVRLDGSLMLGGFQNWYPSFTQPGLWKYTGALTPVAGSPPWVDQIFVADDGAVTMLARFGQQSQSVVTWDGATFTNLGATSNWLVGGNISRLLMLPSGDPVMIGPLVTMGGVPVNGMARWDGTGWLPVDVGRVAGGVPSAVVTADGTLLVAGTVTTAGGSVSMGFAMAKSVCAAQVAVAGAGCAGGAGPLALQADNGPWVGGVFESTATGFTTLSLGMHAIGVQPVMAPLPGGAPGCALFVMPVLTDVLMPTAGSATASFVIPGSTSLAGATLRTQVVGLELDPTLGVVGITSTNALDLTVGAF